MHTIDKLPPDEFWSLSSPNCVTAWSPGHAVVTTLINLLGKINLPDRPIDAAAALASGTPIFGICMVYVWYIPYIWGPHPYVWYKYASGGKPV